MSTRAILGSGTADVWAGVYVHHGHPEEFGPALWKWLKDQGGAEAVVPFVVEHPGGFEGGREFPQYCYCHNPGMGVGQHRKGTDNSVQKRMSVDWRYVVDAEHEVLSLTRVYTGTTWEFSTTEDAPEPDWSALYRPSQRR